MNILHVIASTDPRSGGPVAGVLQQFAHRPVREFTMHIASIDPIDAPHLADFPVTVFPFGPRSGETARRWRWLPWVRYGLRPGLRAWLRENASLYDVVVVNGLWNYATMAARLALVGGRVPYVVFTHGMLDPWFKKTYPVKSFFKQLFWLFNEGPLLNGAFAVLFTTAEEREVSRGAFWPYRVNERVVGYGCGAPVGDPVAQERQFRALLPRLDGRKYLLYLSRIHPKKGCDLLIRAFAEVAAAVPDLDLVVAGPDDAGWRADLEGIAVEAAVAGRVHFPGMLTGDAKWGAYCGCEAFVLPSHQENFGIVVAEAMAQGKPVLISDKVQIWREVEAGGGGLVEPDTLEGTIQLMRRFLALDPAARAAMGAAARETFAARFEMSKAVEVINGVLAEAAGARPA
jgi:glycosyltransferase involved in cell wall biosynthesis